jgi:nitric oxide reductase large subunit
MVQKVAWSRVAGVVAAALLHGAFFYGLAVAQPARNFHAEQSAGTPVHATVALRCVLA